MKAVLAGTTIAEADEGDLIRIGDDLHVDKAWAYPHPYPSAFDRVGRDFSGYVAFDPAVEVVP